jgi:hypothetical protein
MALTSGTRLGQYEIQGAVGEHDGIAYLAMQYLDGETLAATLTEGPLPLERALRHAIEIADALDKARLPTRAHWRRAWRPAQHLLI